MFRIVKKEVSEIRFFGLVIFFEKIVVNKCLFISREIRFQVPPYEIFPNYTETHLSGCRNSFQKFLWKFEDFWAEYTLECPMSFCWVTTLEKLFGNISQLTNTVNSVIFFGSSYVFTLFMLPWHVNWIRRHQIKLETNTYNKVYFDGESIA